MKKLLLIASSVFVAGAAFAQEAPDAGEVVYESIENRIEADLADALMALQENDYTKANDLIRTASLQSGRLAQYRLSSELANTVSSFQAENPQFALTSSSTLAFDSLIDPRETLERRFIDDKGKVVTVRVFGEDRDLSNFQFIADKPRALADNGLERAVMRGEPAIKKASKEGGLSVIMMSEDDHALIEVEGEQIDTVMAFIADVEDGAK